MKGWAAPLRRLLGLLEKEQGGRRGLHVPDHVVGEHLHKQVGTHSVGLAVVDRAGVRDGVVGAEGLLHMGVPDDGPLPEVVRRACFPQVDPPERRLSG